MRRNRFAAMASLTFLASLLAASTSTGQIRAGQFGFTVRSSQGSAGEFCWGADCQPRLGPAPRGETLDMEVRAPMGALFAIGISLGASNCLRRPFIANAQVLDAPVILAGIGFVSQPSAIKACYGGVDHRSLAVPDFLPPGFQFALQALAVIPTEAGVSPALSVAVLATVQ